MNNEDVFTEVGRYFDKLVKQKEKGIYLIWTYKNKIF
jgi:hypothetical protein